jgi:hypothetical protein
MKTITLTYFLIIISLFSCKQNNDIQFQKEIVGEWIFVKTEYTSKPKNHDEVILMPPPPFGRTINGYIFLGNQVCQNKLGYFKRTEENEREERKTYFLGNKTKYRIENDSLKILNLSNNSWESQKIHSLIGDTLSINLNDSLLAKYSRRLYNINKNEKYDKIIVSSSGCYGSCPVLNISIDKNGNVLYYGQDYNTKNGFFKSTISKKDYQNIENAFKKADIKNLKNNYEASRTDDETITITFIKENKIIKSITDYGKEAPIELIWAYTPVRYLYQQVKLVPINSDKSIFSIWRVSFEKGDQICNLTKSESFYLITEILKGKQVKQNFKNKYLIEYWNDQDKKEIIYTDGRFYKFKDQTIDIGYNFLIENNFTEKFRQKNEYER